MSKIVDNLNEKDIKKRLVNDMGFSDKKALVYISLLKYGEATSSEIAQQAQIKRTTVYNIIPELLKEGLVHKYKKQKKTLFYIDDPKDLLDRLEEKKVGIAEMLPTLNALLMSNSSKPKIVQYEGTNGIIQLYRDMLDSIEEGGELFSIIAADYAKDVMPYHILEHYSQHRLDKKIIHKIIGTKNDFILKFKEKDKDELRQTRILEESSDLLGSDIRIFNNKVALLSYKDGFIGVIIESNDLYKLTKIIFNTVWNNLRD